MERVEEDPIIFILGAGASVDSGMKTYRGTNTIQTDMPVAPEGKEELLYTYYDESNPPMSIDALKSNQGLQKMWNHVEELRVDKDNSWNGPTYMKIQQMCQNRKVLIVTQNVDGIIRRQMSFGKNVEIVELHGHMDSATCLQCKKVWSTPIAQSAFDADIMTPRGQRIIKERRERSNSFTEDWGPNKIDKLLIHHCGECGAWLRPDIVLLGESISPKFGFQIHSWIKQNRPSECYVIGTTLQFSYLRQMIMLCRKKGAKIVHINPDPEYQWHAMKEKTRMRDGLAVTTFVKRKKEDELRKEL